MQNILELQSNRDFEILSTEDVLNKCEDVVKYEPIQYTTAVSNIHIINSKTLSINDTCLEISDNTYSDLLNIIALNKNTNSSFKRIIKDERVYDLTNKLKSEYIKTVGDFNVVLFGDSNSKNIIKLKKEKKNSFATNEYSIKLVLEIINKYNLSVTEFNVNTNGNFIIKTIPNKNELIINDKSFIYGEENFYKTLLFIGDLTTYKIIPSTTRIKCLNQLTSSDYEDGVMFDDISNETLKKIHSSIETLKNNDYIPRNFIRQTKRAYNTLASYGEYVNITETVKSNSIIDTTTLNEYFDYEETKKVIQCFAEEEHLDLCNSINSKISTNKNLWELINGATYFASNAKPDVITDMQRLKIFNDCSKILKGDRNGFYDLYFKSNNPFK